MMDMSTEARRKFSEHLNNPYRIRGPLTDIELRRMWWANRRHGVNLPAEPDLIQFDGGRP